LRIYVIEHKGNSTQSLHDSTEIETSFKRFNFLTIMYLINTVFSKENWFSVNTVFSKENWFSDHEMNLILYKIETHPPKGLELPINCSRVEWHDDNSLNCNETYLIRWIVTVALKWFIKPLREILRWIENIWQQKVEQCPQLLKIVLHEWKN
jgi:hypothetical protein